MKDKNNDDSVEFIEDDEYSGEASMQQKMKKLRQKLHDCEEEKKENLAGWQRAKADLINYKKEVASDRTKLIALGKESIINDLLSVIDAFYSAMKNKDSWESVDQNWRLGVEYIYQQLLRAFEEHEAFLILPEIGEGFDENLHELSADENTTAEMKISDIVRPGLRINDKIIRPALVKLS